MSIEFMDDALWPDRIRMTIRGGQDIWITHAEADIIIAQLTHIRKNPIPQGKQVKLAQLYTKEGGQ